MVSGSLRVLWLPPPLKLVAMIYIVAEILLKVALSTITLTLVQWESIFVW
jgi:hypothetical protein